ncbi:conserved Plasmodium protein, unknown function [Plasmodium malariae]|uniref:MARVEL domain-containing protein n=1 Tax=Plasmodium malariae TaxID=5858 RepID=A0A1C3KC66_PLAMA|nr:conserved Plasmodium protein, unknown function [Plasmodium malariae]SBT71165.1 conserved Plasmodium protein, unknown function [Plasmodium malariae]SCN12587.1 conserved Plasmodium protein, unknown function [Plasmodium malariae]
MAIHRDVITFIFGIIASVLLFVIGGMFDNLSYILGCYTFVGFLLTIYTIFAFLIPNTKKSRDFVFSYAVSTACMFVLSLMVHIVITDRHTKISCEQKSNNCVKYVFASVFGFVSSTCFLVTSVLTFKIARVW